MKAINELVSSLSPVLKGNKARINCLANLLISLFAVRSVNLHTLSLAFGTQAKISSRYRRIQRFFAQFEIDYTLIARFIFSLFFKDTDSYYVIIDRTNWYWGKQKMNVFMLAIAYEGQAIPILWQMLNKAGSSTMEEQKALLLRFIQLFGKNSIAGVLADREFGSGGLFSWLNQQDIPFFIRIKENVEVNIKGKKWKKTKSLFKQVAVKTHDYFGMRVEVFKQSVYLAAARSERGELMIVATNKSPKAAIATYLRRWEIESLFQSLKGRGFAFEETHLTQSERIAKLVALLALGFAWAHKVGEMIATVKPIYLKKYHQQRRAQYSYFRYGLDVIRDSLFQAIYSTFPLKRWRIILRPLQQVKVRS